MWLKLEKSYLYSKLENIEQELYSLHLRLTGTLQFDDWRTFDLRIEIVTSAKVAAKILTLNKSKL
jgi:hypothetical protein